MLANRNIPNFQDESVIYHTQELISRARTIGIVFFSSFFVILFTPSSIFQFEIIFEDYKPAIITLLELILKWVTKEVHSDQFAITIGSPMAVIIAYIELALIITFFFNFPFIVYQLYLFLSPGMYEHEKKNLRKFTYVTVALFCIGGLFGIFLLPVVINSLVGISTTLEYENLLYYYDLSTLIGFIFWNVVATGLVFTYPMLILGLVLFEVVDTKDLRKRRRHVISALLGLTAIITPDPTPISMMILSLPLIVLYEMTINVAFKLEKSSFFSDFKLNKSMTDNRIKKYKLNVN